MKEIISLEFTNEHFETRLDGEIVVLNIKQNAFNNLTKLAIRDIMIPWMEAVDNSPDIKGILFINEPGVLGEEEYHKFIEGMAGKLEEVNGRYKVPRFEKSEFRAIEINMIVTYIRKILGLKKVIAIALQGTVVTPYFGVSLAADLRYAAYDTVFSLSHTRYGLHPTGALPFFLPRYIGIGRSVEYLLKGGTITAEEALNLGIINKICDKENFLENCIAEFKKICTLDMGVIKSTKELIYSFGMEFDKFTEKEANYIYR